MGDIGKDKILYLYLDKESMTAYVGETVDIESRKRDHAKYDAMYESKYPGRAYLMQNIEPVEIKADFKSMKAVYFAEHATYEKYNELGYKMVQKPPHPNIFAKYKDRINDCKICDELGCDFTKERLEYILAVYRVSKLCMSQDCNKVFYYDPIRHGTEKNFNRRKYCSSDCYNKARSAGSKNVSKFCLQCEKLFYFDKNKHKSIATFNRIECCSFSCGGKKTWEDPDKRLKQSETHSGENCYWYGKKRPEMSKGQTGEKNHQCKITECDARQIKILLATTNMTHQLIADCIPRATKAIVDNMSQGRAWKEVVI
jgi:hypothetical protein